MIKVNNTLLFCILLTILGILLWGLDKGFDITDEAFQLIAYKYPNEYTFQPTSFQMIGGKLFAWMNPGIITYRFLRLIFTVLSSLVFCWGLWKWLKASHFIKENSPINFTTLAIFLTLGNLVSYALAHQNPSYNHINNHLMLTASGIVLFVLSLEPHKFLANRKYHFLLASAGAIVALQFFVKFSSSLVLMTGFLFLILLHFRSLWGILYLVGGVLFGLFLYFLLFNDFHAWSSGYMDSLKAVSTGTYKPTALLSRYFDHARNVFTHLMQFFLPLFLGTFLLVRLFIGYQSSKQAKELYLLIATTLFLYLFLLYNAYTLELYKGGSHFTPYWEKSAHIYMVVLLTQICALAAIFWDKIHWPFSITKEFINKIIVLLFLVAIPTIGAVGTLNIKSAALMPHIEPWFALILIFLLYIYRTVKSSLIFSLSIITIAVFVLSQVTIGFVYGNYRLADDRINQTESVDTFKALGTLKALSHIKLDIKTKQFFDELAEIIDTKTDFKPGDPIVAPYDLPGVVYALGGISPGIPWIIGEAKTSQGRNCEALSRTKLPNLDRTLLLMQWQVYEEFYKCMFQQFNKWGILSFQKVGEIHNPYTNQMVQIFTPNKAPK
ncbi:hypothetical protein [Candidatus Parabeggiatoa sp. HSG14]|uniref:hypothetical protein n=1 Tax=Candidatus Parabeggiatoa sp. HSG14 TaxID=3055593 RepID=UPI0025A75BB9|nr:hypothetical protein [Thiotrichales bacterium HSG14]